MNIFKSIASLFVSPPQAEELEPVAFWLVENNPELFKKLRSEPIKSFLVKTCENYGVSPPMNGITLNKEIKLVDDLNKAIGKS